MPGLPPAVHDCAHVLVLRLNLVGSTHSEAGLRILALLPNALLTRLLLLSNLIPQPTSPPAQLVGAEQGRPGGDARAAGGGAAPLPAVLQGKWGVCLAVHARRFAMALGSRNPALFLTLPLPTCPSLCSTTCMHRSPSAGPGLQAAGNSSHSFNLRSLACPRRCSTTHRRAPVCWPWPTSSWTA